MSLLNLAKAVAYLNVRDEGNTTSNASTTEFAPAWVAEPDSRGTWSILYSCLFTLTLCVWSAIHLNIPPHGEPASHQYWRKTKWVVIAIFAPELVVYSAWQQYYIARTFCKAFTEIKAEEEGYTVVIRKAKWKRWYDDLFKRRLPRTPTISLDEGVPLRALNKGEPRSLPQTEISMTFGFYVVMGGLTVDVSDIYDNIRYLTATPGLVLDFASKSSWKDFFVDDTSIRDKSKADVLAKSLVCLQVSWTLLQCISRKVAGYPLTILEIHTLVHAVCASIMYGLWFSKPLNIQDPTRVVAPSMIQDDVALCAVNTRLLQTLVMDGRYRVSYGSWEAPSSKESKLLLFDAAAFNDTEFKHRDGQQDRVTHIRSTTHRRPRESASTSETDIGSDETSSSPHLQKQSRHLLERRPPEDIEVSTEIVTGQVLSWGIGPMGCSAYEKKPWYLFWKDRLTVWEPLPGIPTLPLSSTTATDSRRLFSAKYALSSKDILRWQRAGKAFAVYVNSLTPVESLVSAAREASSGSDQDADTWKTKTNHTKTLEMARETKPVSDFRSRFPNVDLSTDSFVVRATNMDYDLLGVLFDKDKVAIFQLLVTPMIGAIYAGVHLLLWNNDFPTPVEQLLWKISGCALGAPLIPCVTMGSILWSVLALDDADKNNWILRMARQFERACKTLFTPIVKIYQTLCRLVKYIDQSIPGVDLEDWIETAFALSFAALLGATALLYCFGRIFLVVESFISLRHVPLAAYEKVTWARYIPHL